MMKDIKIILVGIGFSIACFMISNNTNWSIFNYTGLIFPIVGIIMIINALMKRTDEIFILGGDLMLRITPLKLKDVLIMEYDTSMDNRGTSYNTFSKIELDEAGITTDFIEETVYSIEKKGTLYGIHYQNNPMAQTKLLYCIKGRGLDFAIDLRHDSKTFKDWVCVELSSENRKQIYIPKGFGHAFLSLEDNTSVVMRIDNLFHSDFIRSIAYNDTDINIILPTSNPILSQMDIDAPFLKDSDCNL